MPLVRKRQPAVSFDGCQWVFSGAPPLAHEVRICLPLFCSTESLRQITRRFALDPCTVQGSAALSTAQALLPKAMMGGLSRPTHPGDPDLEGTQEQPAHTVRFPESRYPTGSRGLAGLITTLTFLEGDLAEVRDVELAPPKTDQSGVAICGTPFGVAGPGRAAGRGRGAAGAERGAVGAIEAAAGAAMGLTEGMLGTFPFGLAVCAKFKGRGRGNGSVTGRVGCVPESIADGVGGTLKSPSFGVVGVPPTSSATPCGGSS